MNRARKIIKPVVQFFDDTWLGRTLSITFAILLGVVIVSYAQSRAINRIHEKIQTKYAELNCINVWKQMKKGDEV